VVSASESIRDSLRFCGKLMQIALVSQEDDTLLLARWHPMVYAMCIIGEDHWLQTFPNKDALLRSKGYDYDHTIKCWGLDHTHGKPL